MSSWTISRNPSRSRPSTSTQDRWAISNSSLGIASPRLRAGRPLDGRVGGRLLGLADRDRKSTRLNSSHVKISYAVFCLKKKKKKNKITILFQKTNKKKKT